MKAEELSKEQLKEAVQLHNEYIAQSMSKCVSSCTNATNPAFIEREIHELNQKLMVTYRAIDACNLALNAQQKEPTPSLLTESIIEQASRVLYDDLEFDKRVHKMPAFCRGAKWAASETTKRILDIVDGIDVEKMRKDRENLLSSHEQTQDGAWMHSMEYRVALNDFREELKRRINNVH